MAAATGMVLLALSALLSGNATQAAPRAAAGNAALNAKLVHAARKDELLPQEEVTVVQVGSPVAADAFSGRQLVSLTLRYKGLSNRYCRLAVVDAELNATLVPLLPEALPDDCAKLAAVYVTDLDGDGFADVIHAISVPSQTGAGLVQQAVVYLSKGAGSPPTLCFAAALSGQLSPADLASRVNAIEAFKRARQRMNADALKC